MSPSLILFTTGYFSIIQDFEDNEDVTSFPDFEDTEAVSAVTGEDL